MNTLACGPVLSPQGRFYWTLPMDKQVLLLSCPLPLSSLHWRLHTVFRCSVLLPLSLEKHHKTSLRPRLFLGLFSHVFSGGPSHSFPALLSDNTVHLAFHSHTALPEGRPHWRPLCVSFLFSKPQCSGSLKSQGNCSAGPWMVS